MNQLYREFALQLQPVVALLKSLLQAFQAVNEYFGGSLPVIITIYADRSFTFIVKTPPASVLIKKAAGVIKGSAEPNRDKVGKVTPEQVKEIAELKMPDLNAIDIEGAIKIIEGTARSMGIEVV